MCGLSINIASASLSKLEQVDPRPAAVWQLVLNRLQLLLLLQLQTFCRFGVQPWGTVGGVLACGPALWKFSLTPTGFEWNQSIDPEVNSKVFHLPACLKMEDGQYFDSLTSRRCHFFQLGVLELPVALRLELANAWLAGTVANRAQQPRSKCETLCMKLEHESRSDRMSCNIDLKRAPK